MSRPYRVGPVVALVTALAVGCGGPYGGVTKNEAVAAARRVAGETGLCLRFNDVRKREILTRHHRAWLVLFRPAQEVQSAHAVGSRLPQPADQCVLVWKGGTGYRFREPDVEFNAVQRVGRLWALEGDCAAMEHIVGPIEP